MKARHTTFYWNRRHTSEKAQTVATDTSSTASLPPPARPCGAGHPGSVKGGGGELECRVATAAERVQDSRQQTTRETSGVQKQSGVAPLGGGLGLVCELERPGWRVILGLTVYSDRNPGARPCDQWIHPAPTRFEATPPAPHLPQRERRRLACCHFPQTGAAA